MVQHADADDRVERAALEPFGGLDVADDHLCAVADACAAPLGGRIAQLDGHELAAGCHEPPRELTGACAELERAHARPQPGGGDEEVCAALRADRSRGTAPAPGALEVVGHDLLALAALFGVAIVAPFGR